MDTDSLSSIIVDVNHNSLQSNSFNFVASLSLPFLLDHMWVNSNFCKDDKMFGTVCWDKCGFSLGFEILLKLIKMYDTLLQQSRKHYIVGLWFLNLLGITEKDQPIKLNSILIITKILFKWKCVWFSATTFSCYSLASYANVASKKTQHEDHFILKCIFFIWQFYKTICKKKPSPWNNGPSIKKNPHWLDCRIILWNLRSDTSLTLSVVKFINVSTISWKKLLSDFFTETFLVV